MQDDFMKFRKMLLMLKILMVVACVLSTSIAHSASKTILVLGDSLSAEYGLNRGAGWVPLLQSRLKAEKIEASIINASISGETTSGGKARLQPLLDKHRPDIVIIELGANDGLRGLSIAATEANLRTMITMSQMTQTKVLLLGMQIPPNYGGDYTRRFSAIYPKLAKETKVSLVPFLLEGVADKPEFFQADRIHPTAEAQPIMLKSVWSQLEPLLIK
jgi:acyl-CoA thioesterase-1